MRQPFMIEFHTDNFEQESVDDSEKNGSKGFKLKYKLSWEMTKWCLKKL